MKLFHTPRAAAALLALGLALPLAAPAPAFATRLDTDVICGTAASKAKPALEDVDRPDIEARAAIVVGKDGTVYFERDADAELKIASITKVMTAIVALENAKLTDTVTVDHAAATVGESSADLKEGDTMPLSTALKALMIPSGNDAAMAIASSVGKIIDPSSDNPYQVFIDKMNETAKTLGMDHSVFTNPHGLDFDSWEGDLHSTARDVATMFAHAMTIDDFRSLEEDANNKITVKDKDGKDRQITLEDRNEIRGQEGNIGGKTGGTYEALQCFVGGFSQDLGGEVYTVTLGSDGNDQRWADTRALASWYFSHMVAYPLVTANRTTASGEPLVARVPHAAWTDKTIDATVEDAEQTVQLFSLAGEVTERVDAKDVSDSVKTGDEVGELVLVQGDRELSSEKLVAAEDEAAPEGLDWLLVQMDRLVRTIMREPTTAASELLSQVPAATELDAAK